MAAGTARRGGRRRYRATGGGLAGYLAAVAAAILAGCGGSASSQAISTPTPDRSVSVPSASATPPTPPASADPSPNAAVVADDSLLALFPSVVAGLPLVAVPEAVPEAAADPSVAAVVDRMAFAVAIDPATGDQAVALVAHLRTGGLDAAGYRAWRDSFDRGVCARAGGVAGHAETTLGGRVVAVAICAEGVRTYHVLLADRGLVVSVQSLGERRLGERLLADLRG